MRHPAAFFAFPLSVIALGVLLVTGAYAGADDAPLGAAGMRVYRDPATGAFIPPPAGTTALDTTPPADQALGTRRLVETAGASAAGGVTIDLHGAFQSEITATVDPDGRTRTGCVETQPASR
jgi:hypothetical protein